MAGFKSTSMGRPSQVENPVPGAEAADAADAFLAGFEAPKTGGRAPAEAPAPDSADAFLAGFDEEAPPPVDEGPAPEEFAPEPGFIQANVEQFSPKNMVDRVLYGLAANNKEAMGKLQQKYGPKNVTMKDGEIYFRRDVKDKLKRLDPDQVELFSDLIPDGARNMIIEAAMLPGEVGGAILGSPVPVVGTVGGAIAGRVASVPAANSVADGFAQMAGIPQDPERDRRMENNIGMVAETALPAAGNKVAGMIGKRIPGTAAYKAAREAGEKEVVALSKQSQEVLQASRALEEEGIPVNLMSHQIHDTSPDLLKNVKEVEGMNQFVAKQQEFAEGYGAALENTLNEIKKKANPTGARASSVELTDVIGTLDKTEGKAIGAFRAKAMANLGNQKQQLPAETSELAVNTMKELGFQPSRVKKEVLVRPGTLEGAAMRGIEERKIIERVEWRAPKDMEKVAGRLGLDAGQARGMVNVLNEYGQLVSRGNEARLSDVERLVNRIGPMSQKLRGTPAGAVLGRLAGDLRQHRRAVIASGLDDDFEKKAFSAVMDDFSMIRTNTQDLSGILDKEVTAKTVVNYFFKAGAGPERIRALKNITGKESAQWGALKEEFVNQLMIKHGGKPGSPTGFNSEAFLSDLKGNYGESFLKEVLNDGSGPNYDTVKNLLTVGRRIEGSQRGLKVDDLSEKQKGALAEGLLGWVSGASFRILNASRKLIGAGGDRESALMEILNRDGYEKYLAGYRGKDKAQVAKKLENLLMNYNAARAANQKTAAVLDVGKDVLKRSVRADLREDASR